MADKHFPAKGEGQQKRFVVPSWLFFFGVVINQVLFLVGLNYTSPVNSSIIISTNPIFAFVFAAIILKENISLLKSIGLAIGLSGVCLLILQNGTPDINSNTFIGDIYTLINTISWAFYTVIMKRMLEKYHPVTVMKWTFTFGMFTTIPVGYGQWSTMDWSLISLNGWLGIGFVVVFSNLPRLPSYFVRAKTSQSHYCKYIHLYQPCYSSLTWLPLWARIISIL